MTDDVNYQRAILFLIKEIMDQIDETATLVRNGFKARLSREVLREMCSVLKELSGNQTKFYFDCLIELTTQASTTRDLIYSNECQEKVASSKRLFLKSIMQDLDIAL
jgi:hypothetical protein